MSHHPTTNLILLIIAIAALPLNIGVAQNVSPVVQTKNDVSDPVTDADFYLQKSVAKITELQTFVNSLRSKSSLRQLPYRPVMLSKRDVKQAFYTLDLAKVEIDQLPDHIRAGQLRQYQQLKRQAEQLKQYLTVARTGAQAVLDPKGFPDLKADAVRFRGIGMTLANVDSFQTDPDLAATIFRQLPVAQQEADRIVNKYDILIKQRTIAGIQLAGLSRYFASKRKSFEAIASQQQQSLRPQIKNNLEQIAKQLRRQGQGTGSNKELIGLRDQIQKVDTDLKLLKTIDPQALDLTLSLRKKLIDLQARLQKTEPSNNYVGDDRDDLITAFSPMAAKLDLANLRIPAKNWTRRSYWQYNDEQWLKVDQSVLTVFVLPSKNVSQAATSGWLQYRLTKDHLDDDTIFIGSNEPTRMK